MKALRWTSTVGAQNNFTESRSISVIGIVPNTKFACGKYKHCKMLRDNRHGPDFLLNSTKKFYFEKDTNIMFDGFCNDRSFKWFIITYQCTVIICTVNNFACLFCASYQLLKKGDANVAGFDFRVAWKGGRQNALIDGWWETHRIRCICIRFRLCAQCNSALDYRHQVHGIAKQSGDFIHFMFGRCYTLIRQ